MQSALKTEAVIPVPLLPPVSGLDNDTLFVLPLERGRVWGCIFWRKTHQTSCIIRWTALSARVMSTQPAFTLFTLFLLRGEGDLSLSDSVSL